MTTDAAFLILLFSGNAALIAGTALTRRHWRPDIPPYGRGTRAFDVMRHPERYVMNAPVRAIRTLNIGGFLLVGGSAAILVYELVRTMMGS